MRYRIMVKAKMFSAVHSTRQEISDMTGIAAISRFPIDNNQYEDSSGYEKFGALQIFILSYLTLMFNTVRKYTVNFIYMRSVMNNKIDKNWY